jgi:hypothetical protein
MFEWLARGFHTAFVKLREVMEHRTPCRFADPIGFGAQRAELPQRRVLRE